MDNRIGKYDSARPQFMVGNQRYVGQQYRCIVNLGGGYYCIVPRFPASDWQDEVNALRKIVGDMDKRERNEPKKAGEKSGTV